jgi:hypothetical protein
MDQWNTGDCVEGANNASNLLHSRYGWIWGSTFDIMESASQLRGKGIWGS